MATWGEILLELHQSAAQRGGQPDFDSIRRRYLAALSAYSGRPTIIYYTDWLSGGSPDSSITLEDVQALMEVCRGITGTSLDLILHTPGGSAEATASVVRYLREKFQDIRAFVPIAAMSAGTMWALASNRVVMGRHSQLGPIDPQILQGNRYVPTRAILDQFAKAKDEIAADTAQLSAWYPILQQYGPGLLAECESAEALSKSLVQEWLKAYMFDAASDAEVKAANAAAFFADYRRHRSHSMGISRETARANGIAVDNLEDDQGLQDAVLSVHHATMHTLGGAAVKIVENHLGRAYVKINQPVMVPGLMMRGQGPAFPPT